MWSVGVYDSTSSGHKWVEEFEYSCFGVTRKNLERSSRSDNPLNQPIHLSAVAQELATQPPMIQNTDHMQLIAPTTTTTTTAAAGVGPSIDGGGEAMMPSVPVPMIARMPSYQQGDGGGADNPSSPSQSTTSCTSSSSAAASSSGAAETDGQEGDDEGEEDLRLKSIVDKSKFAFFFGSIFYCY